MAIKSAAGHRQIRYDQDGKFRVLGMKSTSALDNYQLLGFGFLRGREKSGASPRGGILADGMGLGSESFFRYCPVLLVC